MRKIESSIIFVCGSLVPAEISVSCNSLLYLAHAHGIYVSVINFFGVGGGDRREGERFVPWYSTRSQSVKYNLNTLVKLPNVSCKGKFHPRTGNEGQRGSRGVAVPFL